MTITQTQRFLPTAVAAAKIAIDLVESREDSRIHLFGVRPSDAPTAVSTALSAYAESQYRDERPQVLPVYTQLTGGVPRIDPAAVRFEQDAFGSFLGFAVVLFVQRPEGMERHRFDLLVIELEAQLERLAREQRHHVSRFFIVQL